MPLSTRRSSFPNLPDRLARFSARRMVKEYVKRYYVNAMQNRSIDGNHSDPG